MSLTYEVGYPVLYVLCCFFLFYLPSRVVVQIVQIFCSLLKYVFGITTHLVSVIICGRFILYVHSTDTISCLCTCMQTYKYIYIIYLNQERARRCVRRMMNTHMRHSIVLFVYYFLKLYLPSR